MTAGISVGCPACMAVNIAMAVNESEIPYFGKVVITTLSCPQCGFKTSDVLPVEARPPSRYYCKVTGPDQMTIRVVRSGTSTVRIPEMGIRIDPGSVQNGYVTNIEGVLLRIQSILEHFELSASSKEDQSCDIEDLDRPLKLRMLKDWIERLRAGPTREDNEITVIIEDPLGNSAIIGPEPLVKEEALTDEEVQSMTGSLHRH